MVAKVSIQINAPIDRVWDALVNPEMVKQYMWGTNVVSDWHEGSPIFWRGEWQGMPYEDKGMVLQFKPEHTLQYSHFSPLSGQPDIPENYHTVTIRVTNKSHQTVLSLSQDNSATEEERKQSEQNWTMALSAIKKILEG